MVGKENIFPDENIIKKGFWLNNEKIIDSNLKKIKPCYILGYCPYGCIVESFPLREKKDSIISCGIFGHDCPMFYNAEDFQELEKKKLKKEWI